MEEEEEAKDLINPSVHAIHLVDPFEVDVRGGGGLAWSSRETPSRGVVHEARDYIKTWHQQLFVLKRVKLFWIKDSHVTCVFFPWGIIPIASHVTVKGAEDVLNHPNAFELSSGGADFMYFIADTEKEKED